MRAFVFVALVVGSLAAPIALVLLILKAAPLPYERIGPRGTPIPPTNRELADQFFPKVPVRPIETWGTADPVASAEAHFEDSSRAVVAAFQDEVTAQLALEGALDKDPELELSHRTHALRYERAGGKRPDGSPVEILAWTEDNWLYWIDAPSHGALDARIGALNFVRVRPGPRSFAERLLRENFPLVVGCMLAYLGFLAPVWARAASWAGSVEPLEGAKSVDREEMERRLRALDVSGGPFEVEEREGFLFIGWRADDRAQLGPLLSGERQTVLRLRLLLRQKDRTVRARDESAVIDWNDGEPPGTSPPLLEYATERGVMVFEPKSAPPRGVVIEGGRARIEPGAFRAYDEGALRGVVVAMVTQSGWRYRPVLSFRSRRWFG